jgi:hypothetical protein
MYYGGSNDAVGPFSRPNHHNGPPFPIITDQRLGPSVISLWTHPDVGLGTFFVMVDPPPGGSVPKDLKIQIGVQPVSGRLAEVVYLAWPENQRGPVEFKTEVPFDQQEVWKVRLILTSSAGGGEALSKVEATPPGFGRWALLLYLLPFWGAGFLWFSAISKRRRVRRLRLQQSTKILRLRFLREKLEQRVLVHVR